MFLRFLGLMLRALGLLLCAGFMLGFGACGAIGMVASLGGFFNALKSSSDIGLALLNLLPIMGYSIAGIFFAYVAWKGVIALWSGIKAGAESENQDRENEI